MDPEKYLALLVIWQKIALICFIGAAAASVLIFISYQISYASAKSLKEKFDVASRHETQRYVQANYALAIAIFFIINRLYFDTVQLSPVWFFIRMFISLCIGTLHGYIALLIFKYYYPGPLTKKLNRLRYTPRKNPKTGTKLKLLSEDEEDAYLDEGMQAEEDAFSVDYDVWIDPNTGETFIEKYKGYLSALECDRCGFQTLKLEKEEVIRPATAFEDGEIQKDYKCTYCGRIRRKSVKLSKNMNRDTSKMIADPLKNNRQIDLIRLEIHSKDGENKLFEFQNIDQAQSFLEEFDFEKIRDE